MRVLVTGGTGTVGSRVVPRLVDRGAEVRVLTRSPDAASLPAGARAVGGDLREPGTLAPAFEGVDRVFLLTPLHPREAELGRNAVAAAVRAGVERVALLSVHGAEAGAHIPHFGSKVEMARALAEAGLPHVVVAPGSFYQNDLWLRDAILGMGVYPQPLGPVGVNRVDADDIADVVVAALLEEGVQGETLPVVAPEAWTGEATAAAWSRALGAGVVYPGDDLDAWAAAAGAALPEWMVDDLRLMYAHFHDHGLRATDGEVARVREILGREPRPFEAFAAETAAAWRAAG